VRGEKVEKESPASPLDGATASASPRLMFSKFIRGRSVRDAFMLGLRLVAARAMSVLTLVAAAWLVDIQAFAEFGVYQTLATLAGIALFLRYDAAIVAADDKRESRTAFHLCLCLGAMLWLIFALASFASGAVGWMRWELALLLPVSILARGVLRLSYAQTTSERDFKALGRAILVQALIQPAVLLALVLSGVEDVLCFALADIVGHCSGVAYLLVRQRKLLGDLIAGWSTGRIMAVAKKWKSLPFYNLPGSFFSIAFVMSPLLITPMAADDLFAGHVALAYRIFDVPTQIITAAATPVFINFRPSGGRRTPIFGRSMLAGFVLLIGTVYAAIAGVLLLADPILDQTALAGLAQAVPMIALFHLFVALAAPLNEACTFYPQQRRLVFIQGFSLFGSAVAAFVAIGASTDAALLTLAIFAVLRTLAIGELLRILSGLSHRAFTPAGARDGHASCGSPSTP
jgi:hypothetical protein